MTGLVILTLPLNTIGLHIMSNFKDLLVPNFTIEVINKCIKRFCYDFGVMASNLTKAIANIDTFVSHKDLGICYNYNAKYQARDFYYINSFVSNEILGIHTEFPIPFLPSSSWEGENLENRIAYMTFVRDFLVVVDSHKYQNPDNYIGRRVAKKQKPFKSGNKENTIKGIVNPPTLNVPCFTFEEDESYVECSRCNLLTNSL
jgi:hypothetical protein